MIAGQWTGDGPDRAQAGSDLGALRTRASRRRPACWRLYGRRIFITWGDHDCTDNIVTWCWPACPTRRRAAAASPFHRAQAAGERGRSLAGPNDLRPGSIEHKLGIHASPTCVMLFEGAHAELVGQRTTAWRTCSP